MEKVAQKPKTVPCPSCHGAGYHIFSAVPGETEDLDDLLCSYCHGAGSVEKEEHIHN